MNDNEPMSNFFEICTHIDQTPEGNWVGRIRTIRKDTGEEWYFGKTIVTTNRKELDARLHIETPKVTLLWKKPDDWMAKSRMVLIKYLKLSNQITSFGKIMDNLYAHSITMNEANVAYINFWNELIESTIVLSKDIDLLSENERYDLILSRDDVFSDPINPWNLDDLTGRAEVFRFFTSPSDREKALHAEQIKRMEEAFNKSEDINVDDP